MSEEERKRLLSLLESHGQRLLSSFDLPPPKRQKVNENHEVVCSSQQSLDSAEDEWNGFGGSSNHSEESSGEEEDAGLYIQVATLVSRHLKNDGHLGFEDDDGYTASSSRAPDVTVFSEPQVQTLASKTMRKSFMSSKVSNITRFVSRTTSMDVNHDDLDDERSNAQNDALLYRLLHTKLLSGSLNPELNLSHAQREKALSGRVLELSGKAKLGKGECLYRQEEHNKASKRVRDGLTRKKEERVQKRLEEVRSLIRNAYSFSISVRLRIWGIIIQF
ncbi:hypothetical protein ID866_3755 [Astraeus odoratus]|nr:hypothetical protein ID866_3755 [Astraeus odoratus]